MKKNGFYTPEDADKKGLIYLTKWFPKSDIPILTKIRDRVKADPERQAIIVKTTHTFQQGRREITEEVFAVAVNNVSVKGKYGYVY